MLWVIDETFHAKVREVRREMRDYLKNKKKTPPVVFHRGKVVVRFD